jgi:hypothetical protein
MLLQYENGVIRMTLLASNMYYWRSTCDPVSTPQADRGVECRY